ncbi:hypothetical protein [Microcoleus sp. N9_A3]
MIIAVLGSFVASGTLLIYGALETIATIGYIITTGPISSENSKTLILSFCRSCRFVSASHSILHYGTRTLRTVY